MTSRQRFDVLLTLLAGVFLVAYAWPILQPGLSGAAQAACSAAIVVTWLAFVVDYLARLVVASDRRRWFWRHLPDLVVLLLPILRPLRLLRLVTLLQVMSRSGASTLRGKVGVYVGGGAALLGFVAALAALDAERGAPEASIDSFGDALWWSVTTMTTVGYGDTYPVTETGRWIAIGLMLGGVVLLGTVTGAIASWLVEAVSQEIQDAAEEEGDERSDEMAELRAEVRALRLTLEQASGQ